MKTSTALRNYWNVIYSWDCGDICKKKHSTDVGWAEPNYPYLHLRPIPTASKVTTVQMSLDQNIQQRRTC